jgi:hypothetical protein
MGRRVRRLLFAAALAAVAITPALPARAATDYPAGYTGFHTHAEMVAAVQAIAAAHPDIVRTFSIGRSYQGRDLLAAKVSDNVAVDEAEPEVLFDGLTHGNEPMSLEMTLAILRWLSDGYGTEDRVTRVVESREIWIVFAVNPDGQAYDYGSGTLRNWRKNRQPTSGTTAIGTDLNRNYGYHWGGTGSSATPTSTRFRGTAPFSAPETRAMRDFLASRVVGGRQQIRVAISFHEFGRFVMWPYSYTLTDRTADMTLDDRTALVSIARRMATSSGYVAKQASDLYIASGTTADYLYGRYRVFAYTVELSAVDYPKDTAIAAETARNRDAVLSLADIAWCPLAVLGTTVKHARCGPFDDDLEVARGWVVNPDGTDTAPAAGRWARGNPSGTSWNGTTIQPTTTSSGIAALVTGLPAGATAATYDLDGRTTVRSGAIALSGATGQELRFRFLWAHLANATSADHLRAIVEGADGSRTVVWQRTGSARLLDGAWRTAAIPLDPWTGQTIRIRFEALDGASASTLEAGIDDVRVTLPAN